jgi:hypothetical protein
MRDTCRAVGGAVVLFGVIWGMPDIVGQAAAQDDRTGIELAGRSDNDEPPDAWNIYEAKDRVASRKRVARINRKWGYAKVPPGDYTLGLVPQGSGAVEVIWGDVIVAEGKVSTVNIDSGIEVSGRAAGDQTLEDWFVYNTGDGKPDRKPVARARERWGFTPLPAGEYRVSVRPQGSGTIELPWTNVTVAAGKTAAVKIGSGIEVTSRSDKDEPLEDWFVYDAKGAKENRKPVARARNRWGFTPLPPGEYAVTMRAQGSGSKELPWGNIKVEMDRVTALKLDSGIDLVVTSKDVPPPQQWTIFDAADFRNRLTVIQDRWGFTPLVPGEYGVTVEFKDKEQARLRAAQVTVKAGEAVKIVADLPLAERLARVTGAGRTLERDRDPAGYTKLEEAIERAIRRGAAWLKTQRVLAQLRLHDGDYATIGILALIHAGEFERDPRLAEQCIDYLLRRPLDNTYGTALVAMSLRDVDPYLYPERILECAQWLVENQGWGAEKRKVWSYGRKIPGLGEEKKVEVQGKENQKRVAPIRRKSSGSLDVIRRAALTEPSDSWDNSCTQFGVLGLHSSAKSGITVPRESWQRVESHFREQQYSDAGWGYSGSASYGSMTCSGLASLLMSRHHLGAENPALDQAVVAGLEWLAMHFTVEENPGSRENHYYYLYGLERAGVLAGTEFFGDYEWYPVGARYLLEKQDADGSWGNSRSPPTGQMKEYLDTCYAILFLRRATLPLEPAKPAFLAVVNENQEATHGPPAIELILDSSGSMREPVEGRPKNEIASEVMGELLKELPEDHFVGLRLYGHWGQWIPRKTDPKAALLRADDPRLNTDSELVVAIEPLSEKQRGKIEGWLKWAQPRGRTPMVYSLLEAPKDFTGAHRGPKTVVLVSDGEETCGGKIEDVGKAYRDAGIDVVVHVVGFNIRETLAEKQLKEIARLGGGLYFGVSNAKQLSSALQMAIATTFEVWDQAGRKSLARGDIGGDPVPLRPGKYQVRLPKTDARPIEVELEPGQTREITIPAPKGR